MRIDDVETLTGLTVIIAAAVGCLGANMIKPIFNSMSPIGVALACGITTAVAITILFANLDVGGKCIGLMTAYSIGLVTANLLKFNVRFLDPMMAVFIGGVCITPIVLAPFFYSATYTC